MSGLTRAARAAVIITTTTTTTAADTSMSRRHRPRPSAPPMLGILDTPAASIAVPASARPPVPMRAASARLSHARRVSGASGASGASPASTSFSRSFGLHYSRAPRFSAPLYPTESPTERELVGVLQFVSFAAERVLDEYLVPVAPDGGKLNLLALWRQWSAFSTAKQTQLARGADFYFDFIELPRLAGLWGLAQTALPPSSAAAAHRANCATLLHIAWQLPELPAADPLQDPDGSALVRQLREFDPDQLEVGVRDPAQLAGAARHFLLHVLPSRWPAIDAQTVQAYLFLRIRHTLAQLAHTLTGLDEEIMTHQQARLGCRAALDQALKVSTAVRDWAQLSQSGRLSTEERDNAVNEYLRDVRGWERGVDSILKRYLPSTAPMLLDQAGQMAIEEISALYPVGRGAMELTLVVKEFLEHPEYVDLLAPEESSLTHPSRSYRPLSQQSASRTLPTTSSGRAIRASMPPSQKPRQRSTSVTFNVPAPRRPSSNLESRIGPRIYLPSDVSDDDEFASAQIEQAEKDGGLSLSQRRSIVQELASDEYSSEAEDAEMQEEEDHLTALEEADINSEPEFEPEHEPEPELESESPAPPPAQALRSHRSQERARARVRARARLHPVPAPVDDEDGEYDYVPREQREEPMEREERPYVVLPRRRRGEITREQQTEPELETKLTIGPNYQLIRTTAPRAPGLIARHTTTAGRSADNAVQDVFDSEEVRPSPRLPSLLAGAEGSTPPRKGKRREPQGTRSKGKRRLVEQYPAAPAESSQHARRSVPVPSTHKRRVTTARPASDRQRSDATSRRSDLTEAELAEQLSLDERRRALMAMSDCESETEGERVEGASDGSIGSRGRAPAPRPSRAANGIPDAADQRVPPSAQEDQQQLPALPALGVMEQDPDHLTSLTGDAEFAPLEDAPEPLAPEPQEPEGLYVSPASFPPREGAAQLHQGHVPTDAHGPPSVQHLVVREENPATAEFEDAGDMRPVPTARQRQRRAMPWGGGAFAHLNKPCETAADVQRRVQRQYEQKLLATGGVARVLPNAWPARPVVALREAGPPDDEPPVPRPGQPEPAPVMRHGGRSRWTMQETKTLWQRAQWLCWSMELDENEIPRTTSLARLISHYHGTRGIYDQSLARWDFGQSYRDRLRNLLAQKRDRGQSEPWWVKKYIGQSEHVRLCKPRLWCFDILMTENVFPQLWFKQKRLEQRTAQYHWDIKYGRGPVVAEEPLMSCDTDEERVPLEELTPADRALLADPPLEATVHAYRKRLPTTAREFERAAAYRNQARAGLRVYETLGQWRDRVQAEKQGQEEGYWDERDEADESTDEADGEAEVSSGDGQSETQDTGNAKAHEPHGATMRASRSPLTESDDGEQDELASDHSSSEADADAQAGAADEPTHVSAPTPPKRSQRLQGRALAHADPAPAPAPAPASAPALSGPRRAGLRSSQPRASKRRRERRI